MMMKKRSSKLATLKLSIALPVITILFSAFAFKSIATKNDVTPNLSNGNKPIVNGDTTIKRVNVPVEYLKLLEGEYISINEPGRVRKIIFTELLGTLHGWDFGYSYKIIPVGDGKFINPDDHATLEFNTKDKTEISLLLFGKIILKKVKLEKDKFAYGSRVGSLSLAYPLASMMLKDGIPEALSYLKVRIDSIYLAEHEMNFAGYDLLKGEKIKEAAAMFKLSSEMYPNSFNTFDSYAEALLALGDKTQAIENFKKSVKLNPGSKNGLKRLKELGVNTDDLEKKYNVAIDELKVLEGDYLSTDKSTWLRWIKFVVEDGVLVGDDNGYRYQLLPMGKGKFMNPDDGVKLEFNTKDKNAISLLLFGTITLKKVKRPVSPVIDLKNYAGFYLPSKKDTTLKTIEIREDNNKLFRFAETAPNPTQRNIELIALTDNIFIYADKSMRSLEFILDDKKEVTSCILRRYEGVYTLTKKK
jgi:tetratricopeptide (TPR) repeat protein